MTLPENEKLCFVIMPFDKKLYQVYKRAIKRACRRAKFKAVRVDRLSGVFNINLEITEYLFKSDVVIAELTNMNPNVFYEMGVAHTIGNKTIMIIQADQKIPFDIANYRCIIYKQSKKGLKKLENEIITALKTIDTWRKKPTNPVQEFIQLFENNRIAELNWKLKILSVSIPSMKESEPAKVLEDSGPIKDSGVGFFSFQLTTSKIVEEFYISNKYKKSFINIIQEHGTLHPKLFIERKFGFQSNEAAKVVKAAKEETKWENLFYFAVKYYSQAFDREVKRPVSAKFMWQKALDHWGKLFRCEEFWQFVTMKRRLLELSLSEIAYDVDQIRNIFPKLLLEIHSAFVLDYIDKDERRARYHFDIIQRAHLGQSEEESQGLREAAIRHIDQERLRKDLLVPKEEKRFEVTFRLAKLAHLLNPTEDTANFILKAYLAWIRKLESDQLVFIQENYPAYFEITAKIEMEENELAKEIFAEIRGNEKIQALYKKQLMLIDGLEMILPETLKYCDLNKPSNGKIISQIQYFVGRHYCKTNNERDRFTAINYLENALMSDPTNTAARKLFEELT